LSAARLRRGSLGRMQAHDALSTRDAIRWVAAVIAFAWGVLLIVQGLRGIARWRTLSWSFRGAVGTMIVLGLMLGATAFGLGSRLPATLWFTLVAVILWLPSVVVGAMHTWRGTYRATTKDLVVVGLQLVAFLGIAVAVLLER